MRSDVVAFCLIGCWGWGCGFTTPGLGDGSPDGDGSNGECTTTFSSQLDTCGLTFEDLTLMQTTTLNTNTGELSPAPAGTHRVQEFGTKSERVRAIVVRNLTLSDGVQLLAMGDMPLAIVASGRVTLGNGAGIDVSDGGAGALARCSNPAMAGASNTAGGGGGGGAGFSGAGGDGGTGGQGMGAGGMRSSSISMPMGPAGGCAGAPGGDGSVAGLGGVGGRGGGGLYIVAKDAIELGNGVINANGGGGRGGAAGDNMGGRGGGGGGGGSGGMILLEAPLISGAGATIVANGGGGGEGGDDTSTGNDGEVGETSMTRAPGGSNGASSGGDGGRGGAGEVSTGETVTSDPSGGGGGGGGGVGYIRITTGIPENVTISPAPQNPASN